MKGLLLTSVIAVLFAGFVFTLSGRPVSHEVAAKLFVISNGDGARDIAESLARGGLIRSKAYFLFTVWSRGDQKSFKVGSYELSPSMSTREIEKLLAEGKALSNEREVTILEGWTIRDIADYLVKEGVISDNVGLYAEVGHSATIKPSGTRGDWWAEMYPSLSSKPTHVSLEGYLFPDTYRIYVDGDAAALVRRMLTNFETKFSPELRAEAAAKGRSVHQIVTMASIIEREVRGDEDRALVSDIFWRRVAAGRGLEADSTVNYVIGGSSASVSLKDTKIDSPWNTYKYRGLPPGPIGNPGLSAILAALRPKANPYWYFLTDKEGNVHYGKTLAEHNANKAKYLR